MIKRLKIKKSTVRIMVLAVATAIVVFGIYTHLTVVNKSEIKIYFLKDGNLAPVTRYTNKKIDPAVVAAVELIKGPNKTERIAGYFTEIPKAARITSIAKKKNIIEVKFTKSLGKYGGGSAAAAAIVAQIVYTFTEIQGIDKVRILIEDKNEAVLGEEGFVIDEPLSRDDMKL